MARVLFDFDFLQQISIAGKLKGKGTSKPKPKQIRAILSLPAIMQLFDVYFANHIQQFIDSHFEHIPGIYNGAVPRTHCSEIQACIALCAQKGSDDHDQFASAQCDIAAYYDSLPVFQIVQYMVQHGLSPVVGTIIMTIQMVPSLLLQMGPGCDDMVHIPWRRKGGLTGTRTAGALGQIPVRHIQKEKHATWESWGFKLSGISHEMRCNIWRSHIHDRTTIVKQPPTHVVMLTWVDNIYAVSNSVWSAKRILNDFETSIKQFWHMEIKPDSKMIFTAEPAIYAHIDDYKVVQDFDVLGRKVNARG